MNRPACFAAVLFLAACPGALASEAEHSFDSVYGDAYKRVTATPDPSDDVALAAQLLAAARTQKNKRDLLALLCEKAYELGAKIPTGHASAIEAMELAAEQVPENRAACLEKIATVRQRQYDASKGAERTESGDVLIDALLAAANATFEAGSTSEAIALASRASLVARKSIPDRKTEVQTWQERFAARERAEKQAAAIKGRLAGNPQDPRARMELIRLCLVEMDDPAQATTALDETCDPSMRKYVLAAAKGVDAAPEAACLELADWYRGLADKKASPGGVAATLRRARAYYSRYLSLHPAEDLARVQTTMSLAKVEEGLGKLEVPANSELTPGRWIDLLKSVRPAKHVVSGKWEVKDGALIGSVPHGESAHFTIPYALEGSYQVLARFIRTRGAWETRVFLPLGSSSVTLTLGLAETHIGFWNIAPGASSRGPVHLHPAPLNTNQEYQLNILVTLGGDQAEIAVMLDDKPLLHYQGPQGALSPMERLPNPRCLAVGTWGSTVAFKSLRLRMLTGKAKLQP